MDTDYLSTFTLLSQENCFKGVKEKKKMSYSTKDLIHETNKMDFMKIKKLLFYKRQCQEIERASHQKYNQEQVAAHWLV